MEYTIELEPRWMLPPQYTAVVRRTGDDGIDRYYGGIGDTPLEALFDALVHAAGLG